MKKSTVPRLLIATGLEANDVRYATGLEAPDPFGLLVKGSHLHLLVSELEASRAQQTCPSAILHTPSTVFPDANSRRRSWSDQVLEWMRHLKIRKVQVGPYFPVGIARALERGRIQVEVVQPPPFPRRAIKSPHEISCITKSQRAAVAAMRAAIQ